MRRDVERASGTLSRGARDYRMPRPSRRASMNATACYRTRTIDSDTEVRPVGIASHCESRSSSPASWRFPREALAQRRVALADRLACDAGAGIRSRRRAARRSRARRRACAARALGAGIDVANRWAIRADPVTMVVGRDDARLAGDVARSRRRGANDAARAAERAFRGRRPRLRRAARRRLVRDERGGRTRSTRRPSSVRAGRAAAQSAACGPRRARWRRWLTEAQMLLHEHALADARAARPVNALWFSGGGVLPDVARVPSRPCAAPPPGRSGDLLRGIARCARRRCRAAGEARRELLDGANREAIVVALAPVSIRRMRWRARRTTSLAPALDALERGRVSSVTLIADGATRCGKLARTAFVVACKARRGAERVSCRRRTPTLE